MNRFRRCATSLVGLVALGAAGCGGVNGLTEGRALSLPRPVTRVVREVQRALTIDQTLTPGAPASGTCITEWDPTRAQEDITLDGTVASTAGSTNNGVLSTGAQASGRRYFEVVFESLGGVTFNSIVVKADDPVGTTDPSYFSEGGCGLGVGDCASIRDFNAGDVISVLADLDTGRVDFAINGVLTVDDDDVFSPRALAIVPGVGPFRAGVTLDDGARARANFGATAFAYAPPDGFVAWATGEADDEGRCVSATPSVAPPAPVSAGVDCEAGYQLTGINTGVRAQGDDETALVVLGVYQPSERGVIDVRINRPGRYALVVGSYVTAVWNVTAGPDVVIERIIGKSYEGVTINAPGVSNIETSAFLVDGAEADYVTGHAWPYSFGGSDTVGFVGDAEQRTSLPLAIFAGANTSESFTVEPDGTELTTCR